MVHILSGISMDLTFAKLKVIDLKHRQSAILGELIVWHQV